MLLSLGNCDSHAYRELLPDWLSTFAQLLIAIALLGSAFHFWPFGDNQLWQLFCPSNLAVLVWAVIIVMYAIIRRNGQLVAVHLPHVSVLALLAVHILSLGFSPDPVRSLFFVAKLSLMYLGAYSLVSYTASSQRRLARIYYLATVAVAISVGSGLMSKFVLGGDAFGFHGNAYKYGSYLGMLVPVVCVFLFLSRGIVSKLLAGVLVVGLFVVGFSDLREDCRLYEPDGANVKQRYIEWQAILNILEDRPVTGTGPGCINEYRSEYYYRLPKLNTIKPFDQNGYLATAAECGILGLVCFSWIIWRYCKCAWDRIEQMKRKGIDQDLRYPAAALAGLVGACVVNLFSSVHYNGILLVFVVILALIEKTTENISEKQP